MKPAGDGAVGGNLPRGKSDGVNARLLCPVLSADTHAHGCSGPSAASYHRFKVAVPSRTRFLSSRLALLSCSPLSGLLPASVRLTRLEVRATRLQEAMSRSQATSSCNGHSHTRCPTDVSDSALARDRRARGSVQRGALAFQLIEIQTRPTGRSDRLLRCPRPGGICELAQKR
jgi:hypothetical protein